MKINPLKNPVILAALHALACVIVYSFLGLPATIIFVILYVTTFASIEAVCKGREISRALKSEDPQVQKKFDYLVLSYALDKGLRCAIHPNEAASMKLWAVTDDAEHALCDYVKVDTEGRVFDEVLARIKERIDHYVEHPPTSAIPEAKGDASDA